MWTSHHFVQCKFWDIKDYFAQIVDLYSVIEFKRCRLFIYFPRKLYWVSPQTVVQLKINFQIFIKICFIFILHIHRLWYKGELSLCGCMQHPCEMWDRLAFCYTNPFRIMNENDLSLSIRLSVLFSSVQLTGGKFWDILTKLVLAQGRTLLTMFRIGSLFWKAIILCSTKWCSELTGGRCSTTVLSSK